MAVKAEKKDAGKWAPRGRAGDAMDDKPEINFAGGNHFATRRRVNDFTRLMRALPDADPILSKLGKGIPELRRLLADAHLESVWSVRCSTAAGAEWFVEAGAEGAKEKEAANFFDDELRKLNVPRIIEEMMDAAAYGYSPLEIIWEARDGKWGIGNIVGKPPEWFEFNQENRLVFRTGITGQEELPENRFLLVQHMASYANPYGSKIFSKCYWPLAFKRKGWEWWTVFVEKYGGAFMYGKYANNADEKTQHELFNALEGMIADSVAIFPEGTEVTIDSLAGKGKAADIHREYIDAANAEVSKAVLGQTLTTEIGDKGSYAAAAAHNLVREDLAESDRRRVGAAFNRLASVYTFYNFGPGVVSPKFEFIKDEDLQKERAERDRNLYQTSWRPRKGYFIKQYGMDEDDFDLAVFWGGGGA
jgi:phage gp29-like protein